MRFFIPLVLMIMTMAAQAAPANIEDAYARASIPGQSNAAAFATITNRQEQTLTLTGLGSDAAKRVELHEHGHRNGTMQMRKVNNFELEPGQMVDLQKQDMHIMLIDLEAPLQQGEQISITFCFDDDCMDIDFPVISIKTETQGHHDHHRH